MREGNNHQEGNNANRLQQLNSEQKLDPFFLKFSNSGIRIFSQGQITLIDEQNLYDTRVVHRQRVTSSKTKLALNFPNVKRDGDTVYAIAAVRTRRSVERGGGQRAA